jgi:hypothetical protein
MNMRRGSERRGLLLLGELRQLRGVALALGTTTAEQEEGHTSQQQSTASGTARDHRQRQAIGCG